MGRSPPSQPLQLRRPRRSSGAHEWAIRRMNQGSIFSRGGSTSRYAHDSTRQAYVNCVTRRWQSSSSRQTNYTKCKKKGRWKILGTACFQLFLLMCSAGCHRRSGAYTPSLLGLFGMSLLPLPIYHVVCFQCLCLRYCGFSVGFPPPATVRVHNRYTRLHCEGVHLR